jgi:hypothetical protein
MARHQKALLSTVEDGLRYICAALFYAFPVAYAHDFPRCALGMDATRISDGRPVVLKRLLLEEGPYELQINQTFLHRAPCLKPTELLCTLARRYPVAR